MQYINLSVISSAGTPAEDFFIFRGRVSCLPRFRDVHFTLNGRVVFFELLVAVYKLCNKPNVSLLFYSTFVVYHIHKYIAMKYTSQVGRRILCLILSWLTVSPLFYHLARKWNMTSTKLGIFLLLISPMFLTVYAFLFINAVGLYSMEQRKNRFASVEAVEKITGMTIPDFKVVRYLEGRTSFNGDYSDTLIIVFDSVPSESFYKRLNCFIASDSTGWTLDDEVYSFSTMWGNGFPSPKGEDVEEDMTFYIEFCKGSRIATIIFMEHGNIQKSLFF